MIIASNCNKKREKKPQRQQNKVGGSFVPIWNSTQESSKTTQKKNKTKLSEGENRLRFYESFNIFMNLWMLVKEYAMCMYMEISKLKSKLLQLQTNVYIKVYTHRTTPKP